MSPAEEIRAFGEDRKEHVQQVILPALRAGHTVVLDRYFYSTLAYQGSQGANVSELEGATHDIAPEPDIVFLLDLAPEIGLARIQQGRGETPNSFEKLSDLRRARDIFRDLASKHRNIVLLNGAESIQAIHRAIVGTLLQGVLQGRLPAKS